MQDRYSTGTRTRPAVFGHEKHEVLPSRQLEASNWTRNPCMAAVQGKLSSYFTKGRGESSQGNKGTSGEGSVRARLETKLQIRRKTGFAFNFKLDEDLHAEDETRERKSFRFGFNLSDPAVDKASTLTSTREKEAEGVPSSRVEDEFDIDLRESVVQSTAAKQKKKKTSKKRRKGKAKGKGRCKEQGTVDSGYDNATQASREAETMLPSPSVASPDRKIRGVNPSPESDDAIETPHPNILPDFPSASIGDVVPSPQSLLSLPAASRLPPGLTLETWKDPALTVDERRRRRFGHGVRNLAAIQRSCESRRGAPSGELQTERPAEDDRVVKPDLDRMRHVVGLVENGGPTGSSVFAFGFDIGISFNGGSSVE